MIACIFLALISFTNSLKSNAGTIVQVDPKSEPTLVQLTNDSGQSVFRIIDNEDGEPFGPTIQWKINWPVDGDRNLCTKIKHDILDMLSLKIPSNKTFDNVSIQEIMNESLKEYEEEYGPLRDEENPYIICRPFEEIEATVDIWNNEVVNIKTIREPYPANGTPYPVIKNRLFRIDTGQYWTANLLPDNKNLVLLLSSQLVKQGYYRDSDVLLIRGNESDTKSLLEPDAKFWTNEGLVYFYFKRWDLGIEDGDWFLFVTIPYSELLPYLSEEAKIFMPPSVLKKFSQTKEKTIYNEVDQHAGVAVIEQMRLDSIRRDSIEYENKMKLGRLAFINHNGKWKYIVPHFGFEQMSEKSHFITELYPWESPYYKTEYIFVRDINGRKTTIKFTDVYYDEYDAEMTIDDDSERQQFINDILALGKGNGDFIYVNNKDNNYIGVNGKKIIFRRDH